MGPVTARGCYMAEWAYECRSCDATHPGTWFASAALVAEMPDDVRIIRIKDGDEWRCAVVDRSKPVAVEKMLVRQAIESSEDDCPACRAQLAEAALAAAAVASAPTGGGSPGVAPAPRRHVPAELPTASGSVQAAAISLLGTRFVVVLVALDLVRSPGEADLALETLAPSFGGVPIVLMGQDDDGTPHYHGDPELIRLLSGVPLERMPWKEYPLR
jgi:hypothetical protein